MRVLCALTYYRPYISGLTIYVERLATALARRGHYVTVLTSQYDPSLPQREVLNGVHVVRAPVVARVSKGVIMPNIGWLATALSLNHDVMSLHLPQFDAPGIGLRGRLLRQPVVLTYHSDLKMPPGLLNRVANRVIDVANLAAGHLATRVVAYTHDFADHSPFLRRFREKIEVIPPPVEVEQASPADIQGFRRRWNLQGPVIGMAARLASEKGVEILLNALPRILEVYPNARVLFAGPHEDVLGEQDYARRLAPLFARFRDHWTFLGTLGPADMASFFPNLDLIVVPSLNSTETFGLVQVEAMLSGTPSVASALPGVRQPVLQTGMGRVVPIGDSAALAAAILDVLANREHYVRPREEIAAKFSTERTAMEYERLFLQLRG
ncbi:glycosyl transferase group 1 [Oscillochloris trichoides DG-6]|uniref:Glycosyl transferase group 1 n=1 Tax=Oscillochloris trichoides DG-6 TaxID=765420 RepID=E1IFE0_9CHLR|nr:glycosyltransferase family 4 protein [Oscillochloris trichoides]EFO80110.1 glycosyl transferase group 1 [Oscillochloris trichoides DG-6]